MRLKKVKNADNIIINGKHYVKNPSDYRGSFNKLFGNDNLIYLEIGMGKGKFLIESAINNPNINYIGVEKYDSVLVRAVQKSDIYDIPNLKLIRADAKDLENIFFKEIDKIYLNFSDPWVKDRHYKRRLTSYIFLNIYDNLFKNDGVIEMKTDNIKLFDYSIKSLKENGYEIVYKTNDLKSENDIFNIETEYEEKFNKLGVKINKLISIKKY